MTMLLGDDDLSDSRQRPLTVQPESEEEDSASSQGTNQRDESASKFKRPAGIVLLCAFFSLPGLSLRFSALLRFLVRAHLTCPLLLSFPASIDSAAFQTSKMASYTASTAFLQALKLGGCVRSTADVI